jgi:hypothetical protein
MKKTVCDSISHKGTKNTKKIIVVFVSLCEIASRS